MISPVPPVPRAAINLLYLLSGLPFALSGIGAVVLELVWKTSHSLHSGTLFFVAAFGVSVAAMLIGLPIYLAQRRNRLPTRGIVIALALNAAFLSGASLVAVYVQMPTVVAG